MSVGFGFSVGDFIAALQVVSDVIDALRESGTASAECRQLLRFLYDLETALIQVRRLELDEAQADQFNALKFAALQCQQSIDEFMLKIRKYQPYLHSGISLTGTGAVLKQSWYKIKWALCRKEDIEKFRADIVGHTEAINILMNAIQIQRMTLTTKSQERQCISLKSLIQDCYSKAMQKMSVIADLIATSVSDSKKILEITVQTAQMDCKIFGAVLEVQDYLRRSVAPQVLRAQPVYFIDALGIPAPFHLEFIRSSDAFLAVLKANVKGNDSAVERISNGDFVVSDKATKHDIDLSRPWHTCFRPGQQVDMSMIIDETKEPSSSCPACQADCSGHAGLDILCTTCGLTFRRFTEVNDGDPQMNDRPLDPPSEARSEEHRTPHIVLRPGVASKKRKYEDDFAQEMVMYRKVRLRWQPLSDDHALTTLLTAANDSGSSIYEVDGDNDEHKQNIKPVLGDALDFLDKLKDHFKHEPDKYNSFLDILQTYQRDQLPSLTVYKMVQDLLGITDLWEEFQNFVPETVRFHAAEDHDMTAEVPPAVPADTSAPTQSEPSQSDLGAASPPSSSASIALYAQERHIRIPQVSISYPPSHPYHVSVTEYIPLSSSSSSRRGMMMVNSSRPTSSRSYSS